MPPLGRSHPNWRPYRCRGFDNNGNKIEGGCFRRNRGDPCNFVHPDDKEWAIVIDGRAPSARDREPPPSHRRETSGSWSNSHDDRAQDSGYGGRSNRPRSPPPSSADRPTSAGWGSSAAATSSGWGSKDNASSVSAMDTTKDTTTAESWSAGGGGGGWGSSGGGGDAGGGGGGWASGGGGSGWASGGGGGGWGSGGGGSGGDGGGWGASSSSGWPSSAAAKDTDKDRDSTSKDKSKEKAPERSSSSSAQGSTRGSGQGGWNSGSGWGSSAAASDAMEVDDDASKSSRGNVQPTTSAWNSRRSPTPPPPPVPSSRKLPPPPLAPIRTSVTPGPGSAVMESPLSAFQTSGDRMFSGLGLESAALSVLADGSRLRPSLSGSSTPTGSVRGLETPSYDGPSGASRLYTDTIKALRNYAIAEVVYQRSMKVGDQQRAMQKAQVYANATAGTREVLDDIRVQWATKLSSLKAKRDEKLAILAALPDLSAKQAMTITGPMETREAIMQYSAELQSWFQEVQLHERLLLELMESEEKKPKKTTPVPAEAEETPPEPLDPEILLPQLLEKKTWSWEDTMDAKALFHEIIESTKESLSFQIYTKEPDIDKEALEPIQQAIHEGLEEDEAMPLLTFPDVYGDELGQTSSSVNHMGEEVQEQAEDVGNLVKKINSLEQELKSLDDEIEQQEKCITRSESLFPQYDAEAQQCEEDIQALTSKLSSLHLRKEHSARAQPPLLPQQPIDLGQISALLQPGSSAIIHNQLDPILQAILEQSRQNQIALLSELDVLIQPLNAEVDRLLNLLP